MRRPPAPRRPLAYEPLEDRTAPATLTVNTAADPDPYADPNDDVLSLREALTLVDSGTTDPLGNGLNRPLTAGEAAQISGTLGTADRIRFESAPGVGLVGTLAPASDLPRLRQPVDIEGPGAGGAPGNSFVIAFPSGGFQALYLEGTYTGRISGLNLTGGPSSGLVQNFGDLTLVDCQLTNGPDAVVNRPAFGGGSGTLTMDRVLVADNRGAGVRNQGGLLRMTDCTVSGNAGYGVSQESTVPDSFDVRHCTIADNRVFALDSFAAGGINVTPGKTPVRLTNTVAARNLRQEYDINTNTTKDFPADANGAFTADTAFNLVGVGVVITGGGLADGVNGNRVGTSAAPIDARLGVLADNGGPTRTYNLLAGSPALNAGDPAFVPPPETDQRGLPRVSGGRLDIGAFESQVVNTPPRISDIPDQAVVAGQSTGAVPFTIGDTETPADQLALSLASSNPGLIPASAVAFGGFGPNRMVTVTAPPGMAGAATLTVTVTDAGGLTASDPFVVTVTVPPPANTPPAISDIPDRAIPVNQSTGAVPFTVADLETPADQLAVTAVSDNPALVPAGGIVLGGGGANRTVTVTPAAGQTGSAVITVVVSDAGGLTAADTFVLTVTAVPPPPGNTPPTISDIPDLTVSVGQPIGLIPFVIGDRETPVDILTLAASTSTPGLVPASGIVLGGSGANRALTLTPIPGLVGTVTITVVVSDTGGLTATDTFTLTVVPAPPPPPGSPPTTPPTVPPVVPPPPPGSPPAVPPAPSLTGPQVAVGALSANDPQVRVFDAAGRFLFQLNPFEPAVTVTHVALADFTGDGFNDVIVASGVGRGRVMVFDGVTQARLANFFSESEPYIGAFVAAGDFTGDGVPDLVVGAGPDPNPVGLSNPPALPVRVIDGTRLADVDAGGQIANRAVYRAFAAYEYTFRGGVAVAAGDVNGDGVTDVVVGPASNGRSRVRVFDGGTLPTVPLLEGQVVVPDFYAYNPSCLNGINVACGDLDGDGKAEVVTGTRVGGGPHVRVFGDAGGTFACVGEKMLTTDPADRSGVSVAARDLDADGRAELLAGLGAGRDPQVLVLDGSALAPRAGPPQTAPVISRAGAAGGALDGPFYFGKDPQIKDASGNPRGFAGVRNLTGAITLPLSVPADARLVQGSARVRSAVFDSAASATPPTVYEYGTVTVGDEVAGGRRVVRFAVAVPGDIELIRPTGISTAGVAVLSLPFTLQYVTGGGVTAVDGSIGIVEITPVEPGMAFGPDERTTFVSTLSAGPYLQPGRPLAERTRFAAFADPFRGGVYVG